MIKLLKFLSITISSICYTNKFVYKNPRKEKKKERHRTFRYIHSLYEIEAYFSYQREIFILFYRVKKNKLSTIILFDCLLLRKISQQKQTFLLICEIFIAGRVT